MFGVIVLVRISFHESVFEKLFLFGIDRFMKETKLIVARVFASSHRSYRCIGYIYVLCADVVCVGVT